MIKIYIEDKKFLKGLQELESRYSFCIQKCKQGADLVIATAKSDTVSLKRLGAKCLITYDKDSRFYYAFSLLLQNIDIQDLNVSKRFTCSELGIMLDCSRNAVPHYNGIKRYIQTLALMGYTYLELYTEDTYEVEDEPLFGYQRGRYSISEIKKIVEYGELFGIELIPCIQTLAHLNAIFRHGEYLKIRDIDNILLLRDERTYLLIERMFSSIRKAYKTNRINLGMDEAFSLGKGKFFDINGYVEHTTLLKEHLNYLSELCQKYGFERPSMWNDMFFRTKYGKYQYYVSDKNDFEEEIIKSVPKGMLPIYWDYYTEDKNIIDNMIRLSKQLSPNISFAGGAWRWSGFAPLNKKSNMVNKLAVKSCLENGIDDIMINVWSDDGSEGSMFAVLPSMLYVAELCANECECSEVIEQRCQYLFGYTFTEFMQTDLPNLPDGESIYAFNPGKYLFYNDLLLGLYDGNCGENFSANYKAYTKELRKLANRDTEFSYVFKTLALLCEILSEKCDLGLRLKTYYDSADKEGLTVCTEVIARLVKKIEKFYEAVRVQWERENKTFGFEVLDMRLGGLKVRLQNVLRIVKNYISGATNEIEELQCKRLMLGKNGARDLYYTLFVENFTTGRI